MNNKRDGLSNVEYLDQIANQAVRSTNIELDRIEKSSSLRTEYMVIAGLLIVVAVIVIVTIFAAFPIPKDWK